MAARGPTIDELIVADDPDAWRGAGFEVAGDQCLIGAVRVRLAGAEAGRGLVRWSLRDLATTELDGLPTAGSSAPAVRGPAEHPNGVLAIDHVFAFSDDLDRSVASLQAAGLPLRRIRDEPTPAGVPRQAFFRLGEVILEVIQQPAAVPPRSRIPGRAKLWGLALLVESLERPAERLGEHLGEPRDAVQRGRQIATLRRSAGLSVPVAFMTPGPRPG